MARELPFSGRHGNIARNPDWKLWVRSGRHSELPEDKRIKRLALHAVRWLVAAYVWLLRGTPMMVQAMVIYYGASALFQWDLNPISAGLFVVSINTGAYMVETMRGGIQSVDPGQMEGAKAIGNGLFSKPCASSSCRRPFAISSRK